MSSEEQRVPDFLVELYALGELSPEQKADVERRLLAEEGGMARVEALRESNEEILNDYPVSVMSRRIERLAELKATPERSSPYEPKQRQRGLLLAAAAIVLVGIATFWFIAGPGSGAPTSVEEARAKQGGVATDSLGKTQQEIEDEEEIDSERAWRNARAKELKAKLERGKEVSNDDVDTTGLIRAMEKKARRAVTQRNRDEVLETCESAREIDPDACPWLEEELASLDAEAIALDTRLEDGKKLWQDATKHVVKGDFRAAIDVCERGLEAGEERCHRILGLSYKNTGDDAKACEHFKAVGVTSHDGLECD